MHRSFRFMGALLAAALLFSQTPSLDPQSFQLTESKEQVARALGPPALIADFGQDFESWQFQIGNADHDSFSHMVVFRKSTRSIVSVTCHYEPERNVDALFPEAETSVHHVNPQYGLRLRRLSGGRVLIAMGAPKRGQLAGQLVVMRESELRYFYPWLYEQISAAKAAAPETDRASAPGPAR